MFLAADRWILLLSTARRGVPQIIAEVLRAVFSFPKVVRGPNQSGQLKRYVSNALPPIDTSVVSEH